MPFIPHTSEDTAEMLAAIGVTDIDQLFDEIPVQLRNTHFDALPLALNEQEVLRLMSNYANDDQMALNFIGAGAYEHYIPAAVWDIAGRGEFYSAYTPYQAEASQGTLQLIYEYQSMMTSLTAMEVSNASLYDGASALAEAILMAVRLNHRSRARRILMPRSVHPAYRAAVRSLVTPQNIELVEIDYDSTTGKLNPGSLDGYTSHDITALVVPQPNFFGMLEEVDTLTDWAARYDVFLIAIVNPLALALFKPPGEWGLAGADIAVGDGQPLGVPLSFGGPYYGFMCTRQVFVRQMPGRLVGRAIDADGKPGFVLTLQAREQHIRRSRATSNICTNQGLMVTASTIHMALMGPQGLAKVAMTSRNNMHALLERLQSLGVQPLFEGDFFHEVAVRLPQAAKPVLDAMAAHGILGGYDLGRSDPEHTDAILVCATETKSEADLDRYRDVLAQVLT